MGMIHYVRPGSRARVVAGDIPNWIKNNKRSEYILSVVLSAPPWIRFADFKDVLKEKERKQRVTGVEHVLDHHIPLNHPYVCGLTVPWNIDVITRAANGRKSNRWARGQGELFTTPEQFALFENDHLLECYCGTY